jgi:hypothetical protein
MTNRADAEKLYSDLRTSSLSKEQMLLRAILGVLLTEPEPIAWPGDEENLTAKFEDGKTAGHLRAAAEIAGMWRRVSSVTSNPHNVVGESIQFGTLLKANLKLWLLDNGITEEELSG